VLYGHIHREHVHDDPRCRHVAARSLIFAFPDPEKTAEEKPLPFDAEHPFRNLGPRVLHAAAGAPPSTLSLSMEEVELKKGEPVTIRIASADVAHGMYMKALGVDAEIEPGKTTEVTFTPQVSGRFTAICDHFCGAGHGNMHMDFVVE
jgi:heme/copper-type cytochrome/quinol oxidase subunit 2